MNDLANQNMPSASLQIARQCARKQPRRDRSPDLDKALTQEDEILKKMQEMQKNNEKSLEKLMTQNLALRLRKIAVRRKKHRGQFPENPARHHRDEVRPVARRRRSSR